MYLDVASKLQATISKHNRVECGFASILNVETGDVQGELDDLYWEPSKAAMVEAGGGSLMRLLDVS